MTAWMQTVVVSISHQTVSSGMGTCPALYIRIHHGCVHIRSIRCRRRRFQPRELSAAEHEHGCVAELHIEETVGDRVAAR